MFAVNGLGLLAGDIFGFGLEGMVVSYRGGNLTCCKDACVNYHVYLDCSGMAFG